MILNYEDPTEVWIKSASLVELNKAYEYWGLNQPNGEYLFYIQEAEIVHKERFMKFKKIKL